MALSKSLERRLDEAKKSDEYWMDSAKLDFAIAIEARRRVINKSYADLARAINTSNAYISKVFRGDANLTIESMVKLARAVGCNINIDLLPISAKKTPQHTKTPEKGYSLIPETKEYKKEFPAIPPCANDPDYAYAA